MHPRRRVSLNVAGDFYVEEGCCTLCGVPDVEAPELFGGFEADGRGTPGAKQCWVKKQPKSTPELDAMIRAVAAQEFECIRYGGTDQLLIDRLRTIRTNTADLATSSLRVSWRGTTGSTRPVFGGASASTSGAGFRRAETEEALAESALRPAQILRSFICTSLE
jgi:hypothetical protein